MTTTGPVNIQQILQMGTHVEKLQQTVQHQPVTTAQQLDEERKVEDEMRRTEVQDAEDSNAVVPTDPEGSRRKQIRLKKKASGEEDQPDESKTSADKIQFAERSQGGRVDLQA